MRVPLEWLSEYTELPADSDGATVAAALVRVGLEEEGRYGAEVSGPLVVGRVLSVTPEPQKNGKTINWCLVDVGTHHNSRIGTPEREGEEPAGVGIVCGAHNFEAGDLVVVILPGGELPGGFVISARKTYGHVSNGMICSAAELGLGEDHDGIIVLSRLLDEATVADLVPGQDAIALLGLDREVIEVNVTPDRGYCFSMRGIAREYALSTGSTFADPAAVEVQQPVGPGHAVQVQDEAPLRGGLGCDHYVARIVRGLDLQRSTPAWMKMRLTEAGMRPISLAVDVTNYVMLALGQPLHAFDLSALQGPIVVRRARAGETLTTLDDVERPLHPEDLLITDESAADGESRILALAGVMGGASSEVGESTTDVLIEAAHFDQWTVARTARRHKLATEASKRFERGVDPELAAPAAHVAVSLLVDLGGGTADEVWTEVDHRTPRSEFAFDTDLPRRYTGVDYGPARVVQILRDIGCQVTGVDGTVTVLPPSWRPDLRSGPDLVEEVARIDGYDRIASIVPRPPGGRGLTHAQRARRTVSTVLAAQGLSEVLTLPFVSTQVWDDLEIPADDQRRRAARLRNPLSEEAPVLRTELIQTLPDSLRRNVARGIKDVALFEIGTVVRPRPDESAAPVPGVGELPEDEVLEAIRSAVPPQPLHLAMMACGQAERAGWWGGGRAVQAADVIGWASAVGEALGVTVSARQAERAPWHPGRCVELVSGGAGVGWAGELHPRVLARLGLPARSVAAELDLDAILSRAGTRISATPISTHPLALSDVALLVPSDVPRGEVLQALRSGAGDLLESIALFDVYTGDQVGASQQSLAFRLTFRAPDRTLTTDEVNAARDAAVASAAAEVGAVQR